MKLIDDKNTLQKRFSSKFSANTISLIINLIINLFVPRTLGTTMYGNFNFLTTFFQQIVSFFNLWITPAYYVKLSQRPKEFSLIVFTLYYISISITLIFCFVLLLYFKNNWTSSLLPDQEILYIVLAFFFVIFQWLAQILTGITDAFKITIKAEKLRMYIRILGLILFIILLFSNNLNLTNFFIYNFIVSISISISFLSVISKSEIIISPSWAISKEKFITLVNEFSKFSNPLLISGLVSVFALLLDRWFLQFYWGSTEQGYYGISQQIGIICFLFTGSMSALLINEFSVSFSKNNIKKIAQDFKKYIPLLYSLAAYFGIFVAINSITVVEIIGGSQYKDAALTVAIMSFYPIHQTYGQLSGAVFLTTNRTNIYSKISIILTLVGIPLSYLLITENQYLGFNLGASGLAIKMVLIQFIAVTIQLVYNAKYLNLVLWKYLAHQILCVVILFFIAFLSNFLVNQIHLISNIYLIFICNGFLYSIIVVLALLLEPRIFGLNHNRLKFITEKIYRLINFK
jgi:O-antigen/teichoic acid export membrane protein